MVGPGSHGRPWLPQTASPWPEEGTHLAIGTAGPAPSAVSAASLVIVAKVPCPTLHVSHSHARATGQAGSQVGRVRLLLAGSGLHVARVPSRAAMLAVLTAHGLRGTGWPSCLSSPTHLPAPTEDSVPLSRGGRVGTYVRQLAAGPAPTQAGAAGLPHRAAGVLVTAHVSVVRQGGLAGRRLLQPSHRLASLLTPALGQARVAMGAAMLVV